MSSESLQELINVLAQTGAEVTRLASDISSQDLRHKNSAEEFSALENILHLRDIEVEGYTTRINRILNETNPSLPDIDGARLAIERNYNTQDPAAALEDFDNARKRNIQTLRNLRAEQFEREGTLEAVGTVSLRKLIEMMREHDEDHIRELNIIQRRHRGAATT